MDINAQTAPELRAALDREVIEAQQRVERDGAQWNEITRLNSELASMAETARQDAENLKVSEVRYRRLFESAKDGILILDAATGKIEDVNPYLCHLLSYAPDDFLGKQLWEIGTFRDIAANEDAFRTLNEQEYIRYEDLPLETKDGQSVSVEFVSNVYVSGDKKVIQCNIRDITGRKAHEIEIERLSRLYAALSEVNQAIVRLPSRDELFQQVCKVLVEQGGFCMAWIGWHNSETQVLVPVADWGDVDGYLQNVKVYGDDRPEGRGPAGTAFRTGHPYTCNDISSDGAMLPWRAEAERRGFHSCAVFPVRLKGAVCATLSVYSEETGFFQDKEIALLTEAAADVSFALDNFEREAEHQRAEEALRQSESSLAGIVNSAMDAIITIDDEQRIVLFNPTAEHMFGYDSATILGQSIECLIPERFRAGHAGHIQEFGHKGITNRRMGALGAISGLRANGEEFPIEASISQVEVEGHKLFTVILRDITERKQAEAERARLLHVLEASLNEIYIFDAQTLRFQYANDCARRNLGYSMEAMNALTPVDLKPEFSTATFNEAIGPLRRHKNEKLIFQTVHRRADESLYPVEVHLQLVERDGDAVFLAVINDITGRVQAEAALRESEEGFRTMANSMSQLAWIANADGFIHWYNQRWYEYTGTTPEAMEGWGWQVVHDPAVLPKVMEKWTGAIDAGQPFEMEFPLRGADGKFRTFLTRGQPLKDSAGKVLQWFGTNTDVEALKQSEEKIRQLNAELAQRVMERTAQLEAANKELEAFSLALTHDLRVAEAADRFKSAFLATMSHELRTPLNSIIGFTGLVLMGKAGPLSAEQAKQLGMVRESAWHLLSLINDVLDLSKIEAGQFEIHAEAFDLPASIGRVTAMIRPLAEKKGLVLTTVMAEKLGEMVGDQRRVEQILLNLLSNAIKFTEHGSVKLSAELVADFQASPDATPRAVVRLQVTDTGIGLQPDQLAILFQPFRQIDTSLSRKAEGTGLGLAISQRLATLLGGEISAASDGTQGSEFTVILPLQKPSKHNPTNL